MCCFTKIKVVFSTVGSHFGMSSCSCIASIDTRIVIFTTAVVVATALLVLFCVGSVWVLRTQGCAGVPGCGPPPRGWLERLREFVTEVGSMFLCFLVGTAFVSFGLLVFVISPFEDCPCLLESSWEIRLDPCLDLFRAHFILYLVVLVGTGICALSLRCQRVLWLVCLRIVVVFLVILAVLGSTAVVGVLYYGKWISIKNSGLEGDRAGHQTQYANALQQTAKRIQT